ncbi:DUF4406 domain-containing protein [Microvirga pudoricolor]|uniref:DUF4406 domain-containing protein n=1 Tax=Microvirga pudoricolor TaxID=2778729 RepID=UPI001951E7F4|nr:DUF4406 domain-containing protein [Microvirga pudoricolor]MBM6594091.1 DUF4406 domain-containing protein [Microvirga pudoricolor]
MWIWICGPYAGDGADRGQRAANLRVLNEAALQVFAMGHTPLIGANMALPMIEAAGLDDASHGIRLPLSLALLERCDACLRLGGASAGSDKEVARFEARGLPGYRSVDAIPAAH